MASSAITLILSLPISPNITTLTAHKPIYMATTAILLDFFSRCKETPNFEQ